MNKTISMFDIRSKILHEKKYLPWQPGFELFSINYKNHIVEANEILYDVVSDYYEITSEEFAKNSMPTIPDGCTDLMFTYDGSNIQAYISAGVRQIQNFYFGSIKYLFGVRFMPGKTHCIFHCSIDELVHHPVSIELELKNSKELIEQFSETTCFEERIGLIQKYVLQHWIYSGTKETILEQCLEEIYRYKGCITVEKLSEELLYCERYLQKLMKEYTGVSTKSMCQIVRQQYAAYLMYRHPEYSITNIAVDCGYSDLNHMNREFKKYIHCNALDMRKKELFLKREEGSRIVF